QARSSYLSGVTSPADASPRPNTVAPRPAPSARRRAAASVLVTTSKVVLVLGIVVAVAAAFGPVWLIRAGIAAMIVAAVVACVCAWRELSLARQEHSAAMLAAAKNHGKAL